jgi:hypothetical protein
MKGDEIMEATTTRRPKTARLSRKERNELMERLCAHYANAAKSIYRMQMRDGYCDAPHAPMQPSDWLWDAAWEQLGRMMPQERLDRLDATPGVSGLVRQIMSDACVYHKQVCEFVGWDERYPQIDGYRYGDSRNARVLR